MEDGARVDLDEYEKDSARDFALWKAAKPGETSWDTAIGRGRPGWHIECSAMSMAKLLAPFGGGLACDDASMNIFDIHGGGIDLVFPHHENEIAQSCCAFNTPRMANVWMHNGFLQVEGEKMSKSLGNFITIHELLHTAKFGGRKWPGEVLRLAMLRTQYRQPIDWTLAALEEAEKTLDRWYNVVGDARSDARIADGVLLALDDDLNTPAAVAELHRLAHPPATQAGLGANASLMKSAANLLGLLTQTRTEREGGEARPTSADSERIEGLLAERAAARANRDWKESDRLRDELATIGVVLQDNRDGATTWEFRR
jgi:cysteinyl-tRNA synthetase